MTRISFFLPFPLFILLFPHFSESAVGSPGAFYLQMMLPKFGNTARVEYGEYSLSHCPFSAFDVGWSVWSRRGQVGRLVVHSRTACTAKIGNQGSPFPSVLSLGKCSMSFQTPLLECQQNSRDLWKMLKKYDLICTPASWKHLLLNI